MPNDVGNKHRNSPLLSRRDLTKALGMTAAALWLTGLGAGPARAQSPKKGGHMKFGLLGGATSDTGAVDMWVNSMLTVGLGSANEFLTDIRPDGTLAPRLAESWETADKGKTWVFKLRRGVVFSNGKTVDADDVVASWNYHKTPGTPSGAKVVVEAAEAKSDGPETVVFTCVNPSVDFPYVTAGFLMPIMAAKDGKIISDKSDISAGPYFLDSFEPGIRTSLKKNPNYWTDAIGHFDSVEFINLQDGNARVNALMTGEVQAVDSVPVKLAKRLEGVAGVRVLNIASRRHYCFSMRTDRAPFSDNHVRMALKYGVDRQQLLTNNLFGYGSLGNDQPFNETYKYFDRGVEQRAYDPDKARWHLKQAGLDSVTVTLRAGDAAWEGDVDASTLFRESASKAGITIDVQRVPKDGYWTNTWKKTDFFAMIWNGRPTEMEVLTQTFGRESPYNETLWDNERFNKLLVELAGEFDEGKRAAMFSEAQHLIRDNSGNLTPVFANWIWGTSSKVATPERVGGNYTLDGGRAAERWWFA